MGLQYLTSKEIYEQQEHVRGKLGKPSEFLLSGIAQDVLLKYAKKDARIIELGCGGGEMLHELQQLGYSDLWAVDIDDYLYYREFEPHLRRADLHKDPIPFDTQTSDAVIAFNLLEHLENPFHFARECARVLKEGGYLFLSVPNGNTILDKISFFLTGNLLAYRPGNNHITFLLDVVFAKAFLRDFKIIEMKYGNPWVPWLRPKRWNKKLPKHPLLSYNKLYVLQRTR